MSEKDVFSDKKLGEFTTHVSLALLNWKAKFSLTVRKTRRPHL